jgi:hypothetical protein
MRYLTDAGHGWLEVSLTQYPDAVEYGTGFGYLDAQGQVIYLEEDCEMGAFLRAHPEARERIYHENFDGDSAVRRLPRNEARLDVSKAYA